MLHQQVIETKQTTTKTVERAAQRQRRRTQNFGSFVFVVPYLIAFAAFLGFPILFGIYISLN